MKKALDPGYWGRALGHPIVLLGLIVDLLPIYAVFAWGWTAAPLVLLYWMENIIAGAMTLPRLIVSGAGFGGLGLLAGAGLSAFFIFHYGLFCAVHGTFLMAFVSFTNSGLSEPPIVMDIPAMFGFGLKSAPHVDWVIFAIIAFQLIVLLSEFIVKGGWRRSNPMAEMFAPYARIVVLHFGIFAGAAALFLLGQPMIGVLGLILFRAVWGVMTNSKLISLDGAIGQAGGREQFEALLKGKQKET